MRCGGPLPGRPGFCLAASLEALIRVIEKRFIRRPGVERRAYGQYENFMMLGKDALWAMLISTLVANDLY